MRLDEYERLLVPRTRIAALSYVSNALGTVNPLAAMIRTAHARGVPVLVDGAQAVQHLAVDVQALDCDFFAFSGHKIYGPTGIGVLYGKRALLEAMPPWQGGGDMIAEVTFEGSTWNRLPYKFEAGTPAIAATIGLAAGLDYVSNLGLDAIAMGIGQLAQFVLAQPARGLRDELTARKLRFVDCGGRALLAPRAFYLQLADFPRQPFVFRLQMLDCRAPAVSAGAKSAK